jgi:hypothetical protein
MANDGGCVGLAILPRRGRRRIVFDFALDYNCLQFSKIRPSSQRPARTLWLNNNPHRHSQ